MNDVINNPQHYTIIVPESQFVCDILQRYNKANWRYISAFQYLVRAPFKGNEVADIRKCLWYLEHGAAANYMPVANVDVSRLPVGYQELVRDAASGGLSASAVVTQLGIRLAHDGK